MKIVYLCVMGKTDLTALYQRQVNELTITVDLLRGQLEQSNAVIRSLTDTLSKRDATIEQLTDAVNRLTEALEKRESDLKKQENINRGLGKLVANRSEKVRHVEGDVFTGEPSPALSDEELDAREERRRQERKQRGNNGARHFDYSQLELEEIEHDILPDSPTFNIEIARLIDIYESYRFEYVPAKFIKHKFRLFKYSQNGEMMVGRLPQAPLQNSRFDGSFIAGLLELRFMLGLPENRISSFFTNHGFPISRKTINGLLRKSASLLDGLYDALGRAVLEDDYLSADETYVNILLGRPAKSGRCVKRGYLWNMIANNLGLVYFFYENGSRKAEIIYSKLTDFRGTIQSDGFSPYRTLGSDEYPHIMRLPCLQHIKRKFGDMDGNADAKKIFDLLNLLYFNEHRPEKEKWKDWTEEKHTRWRRDYSKGILKSLRNEIVRVRALPTFSVDERLRDAVTYLDNEMRDLPNIFTDVRFHLDNNIIERYNRAVALSRHSSLFFGSHDGAKRGALFHSLAASCRMNGIDFFEYISNVLNRLPSIKPTSGYEVFRELLPDKWHRNTQKA